MSNLEELKNLEPAYRPNETVAGSLAAKSLTALVGPYAVGKTTLMDAVRAGDAEFGRAQSFTTRDQEERDSNSTYTFLPHTEETFGAILEEVERGDLVQYAIHGTTGRFYGSRVENYPQEYMMVDILAAAIEPLSRVPFREFNVVSVVAPPADWLKRVKARADATSPAESAKRIQEAVSSLEWSLQQEDMAWLSNADGRMDYAANQLKHFIKYGEELPPSNRKLGELMLRDARLMQA